MAGLRQTITRVVSAARSSHSIATTQTLGNQSSYTSNGARRMALAIAAAAAASTTTAAVLAHCHADAPTNIATPPFPINAAEPLETDLWNRWDQVKSFLTSWRRRSGSAEVPLPADKLACHLPASPRSVGETSLKNYRPVVLVCCGSFNPPTVMHLRMLELARQAMVERGNDVLGAYLSPVNDAYWKKALAPGRHRVRMCQLATHDSDFIMTDSWEVEQRTYTRTLFALQSVRQRLKGMFEGTSSIDNQVSKDTSLDSTTSTQTALQRPQGCPPTTPRVVLVCGADVVESMADPSIWRQDLLESLLAEHGVVCISRDGAGIAAGALLEIPGTLLHRYKDNVVVVQDPVPNDVSSSAVRHELEQGRSVKYLVPDAVIDYMNRHGLYKGLNMRLPRALHPLGGKKIDTEED